jgi:hypothetical protein
VFRPRRRSPAACWRPERVARGLVHADVGRLRGQDDGDQQFEGVVNSSSVVGCGLSSRRREKQFDDFGAACSLLRRARRFFAPRMPRVTRLALRGARLRRGASAAAAAGGSEAVARCTGAACIAFALALAQAQRAVAITFACGEARVRRAARARRAWRGTRRAVGAGDVVEQAGVDGAIQVVDAQGVDDAMRGVAVVAMRTRRRGRAPSASGEGGLAALEERARAFAHVLRREHQAELCALVFEAFLDAAFAADR